MSSSIAAPTPARRSDQRSESGSVRASTKSRLGNPAQRGSLVIEKKAVERIVRQVASESAQTGGTSGGVLGMGAHSDPTASPDASVELMGQSANVAVNATISYPTPIREATNQMRERIVARVKEMTGIDVTRVDITVNGLHRATSPDRKVL